MTGARYNEGKAGFNLLPLDALKEICKVYDFGATKYAPWNWAKGLSWSETQASLMRHLAAWSIGEERDEESGLHHDVHIAWNAITLVAMRLRLIGTDDRFKLNTISDDVPGHPIKRDISDPVVPVTTPDYPIPGSASDYVPDVVRPDNYYPDAWRTTSTKGSPVPSSIK